MQFRCSLGREFITVVCAIYLNDTEEAFILKGFEGIDTGMFKLYLCVYAADSVLMSETETGLQKGLYLLKDYCWRWKLSVNVNTTKVMIFLKKWNK